MTLVTSMLGQVSSSMMTLLGQGAPAGGGGAAAPGGPNPAVIWIGLIVFMGVFFFISTRSQKKERQKTADMLSNLKKNDKVLTVGGVVGTVMNVKENEVVLKVDESTNTRMTFLKRAIQQVLTDSE